LKAKLREVAIEDDDQRTDSDVGDGRQEEADLDAKVRE
jgi:hypothetical protein